MHLLRFSRETVSRMPLDEELRRFLEFLGNADGINDCRKAFPIVGCEVSPEHSFNVPCIVLTLLNGVAKWRLAVQAIPIEERIEFFLRIKVFHSVV